VKLADFGFSKETEDDQDLFETLGTPPYMGNLLLKLFSSYSNLPF
jgi:hypothetical protein